MAERIGTPSTSATPPLANEVADGAESVEVPSAGERRTRGSATRRRPGHAGVGESLSLVDHAPEVGPREVSMTAWTSRPATRPGRARRRREPLKRPPGRPARVPSSSAVDEDVG